MIFIYGYIHKSARYTFSLRSLIGMLTFHRITYPRSHTEGAATNRRTSFFGTQHETTRSDPTRCGVSTRQVTRFPAIPISNATYLHASMRTIHALNERRSVPGRESYTFFVQSVRKIETAVSRGERATLGSTESSRTWIDQLE